MTQGAHRTGCADCEHGLEHCHGTLLEHRDGQHACTEDGCRLPVAAHVWMGRCTDVDRLCGCPAATPDARAA